MVCDGNCNCCNNPIILNGSDPEDALDYFRHKCRQKNILIDDSLSISSDQIKDFRYNQSQTKEIKSLWNRKN